VYCGFRHKPEVVGSGEVFYLSFHWLIVKLNMAVEQRRQTKRLLTGTHVSGSFGEYYDNPNPDVQRRKRQRIYGTLVQACGERKYTVQFDCGMVMKCYSHTLCLENQASSLPPSELQAAAKEVKAQGEHADATAVQVVEENEAAVQDAAEEEHLPETSPEDDESVAEAPAGEEEEPAQSPVGIVAEAPVEDFATYAGRKAAAPA